MRLRPQQRTRGWSFGFVETHAHDGCSLRVPTLIAEHTRPCLAPKVARRINSLAWRGEALAMPC